MVQLKFNFNSTKVISAILAIRQLRESVYVTEILWCIEKITPLLHLCQNDHNTNASEKGWPKLEN